MSKVLYSQPKLKKQIIFFCSKYLKTEEPNQTLIDLLSKNEILVYLTNLIDSRKDMLVTNQSIINLIMERFPEWTLKALKKRNNLKNYTDEEKEKAIEILTNKDPLEFCLNVLCKQHIGEKPILLLGLISAVSSGLRDRKMLIHLMGVGGSGKGKTDALETVGKICSNYQPIISASPKNIFYKAGEDMLVDNGILFFPENDTKDVEFQALERVLTDDKDIIPKHETVINQQAKSLEIKQINVMWRNSVGTTDDEDNQLNNRYYIFNVDETKEQDELVYNHILDNWNVNQKNIDEELKLCNLITDLIKSEPCKVIIPYISALELSFKDDRRTIKKFLRIVSVVTYFYRFQRARCDDMILSERKDFNIANLIWNKINKYESSKLPEYESNIINEIAINPGICVTELADKLGKDISNLNKKIQTMEDRGLIYSEKHTINSFNGENRVTKPKKVLSTTKTPQKIIRFGSSDKIYKMAIRDLERLNIKELEIPKKCFGGFGSVFQVRERKDILKFLEILFKDEDVSHFLGINHNINNIYNNNIYTLDSKIQKNGEEPKPIPKPHHNKTKTHQEENID